MGLWIQARAFLEHFFGFCCITYRRHLIYRRQSFWKKIFKIFLLILRELSWMSSCLFILDIRGLRTRRKHKRKIFTYRRQTLIIDTCLRLVFVYDKCSTICEMFTIGDATAFSRYARSAARLARTICFAVYWMLLPGWTLALWPPSDLAFGSQASQRRHCYDTGWLRGLIFFLAAGLGTFEIAPFRSRVERSHRVTMNGPGGVITSANACFTLFSEIIGAS